jgi:SAM-dependent methyltransferase
MMAPREVVPIIMDLVKPKNVLDVGCGTGTWLKAFEEAGVINYIGIDGNYVDSSQLNIPDGKFVAKDLSKWWSLNGKFDLVLSLEVAEHLPGESADLFVETLVNHANENIIFSAAIPNQGGQNHLNEQWPEYWQQKFLKHGFYFHDVIRPLIWHNEEVDWWYRQNIFLVNRQKKDAATKLSLIHPQQFNQWLNEKEAYTESLLTGRQGIRISANIFFNALIFKMKNLFR